MLTEVELYNKRVGKAEKRAERKRPRGIVCLNTNARSTGKVREMFSMSQIPVHSQQVPVQHKSMLQRIKSFFRRTP